MTQFPGIIQTGSNNTSAVKAIQLRLKELGIGGLEGTGNYGTQTTQAVKLFQARFTDSHGNPLHIDGVVGAITWEALFGAAEAAQPCLSDDVHKVLTVAIGEIGKMEEPAGSNWGPAVKAYLASVGINFPASWCAGFVYWCFQKALANNPVTKTGGVLAHWNATNGKRITAKQVVADAGLVKPGQVFIMDFGGGQGHTGLVEKVANGFISTIEGNTNNNGSREGIGVFRKSRKINSINKGFIEYL